MARVLGINHVALEVGDVDEALSWYGRFFEFELRGRAGAAMAFIDMGDQFIALASGRAQPPDGDRHFGLVVDDREAVRAELQQAGVPVQGSGSVDFLDPWGNHVQVLDYREIQFTKRQLCCAQWTAADSRRRTRRARSSAANGSSTERPGSDHAAALPRRPLTAGKSSGSRADAAMAAQTSRERLLMRASHRNTAGGTSR